MIDAAVTAVVATTNCEGEAPSNAAEIPTESLAGVTAGITNLLPEVPKTRLPLVVTKLVPAVTIVAAETEPNVDVILPVLATILPVVAVIPVPAVTVVAADTEPKVETKLPVDAVILPVVAVIPVPAVTVVVAETVAAVRAPPFKSRGVAPPVV
jgi:hypothetical protein